MDGGFAKRFPTDAPHLDEAFQNFERLIEEIVLQEARVHTAPWDRALQALLQRAAHIRWWLTGSAALAVRGIPISPRDLDLVVDDEGARTLGEALLDGLVEPVSPAEGWISRWWGRAFLHARIEWAGGVDERADQPLVGDVGPAAAGRLEEVRWRGYQVLVPPLDLQLAVNERRGLTDRIELIRAFMAEGP